MKCSTTTFQDVFSYGALPPSRQNYDRKMLKSTHKPVVPSPTPVETPLPARWTEHLAPSGHSYYYNADTQQSTYTRPTQAAEPSLHVDYNAFTATPANFPHAWQPSTQQSGTRGGRGSFRGGRSYQDRSRRNQHEDRPKSKAVIPEAEPWILVKTKLGRRFVYNSETGESFWKFPQDVLLAVAKTDMAAMEKRNDEKAEFKSEETAPAAPPDVPAQHNAADSVTAVGQVHPGQEDDSDSYEEVEVTDDEDDDAEAPTKKPRVDEEGPAGPIEYNEDDIAYQLAEMGEDYDLDPGEYGEEYAEGEEGLPLTEEDSKALFRDLLDDYRINPYGTWDKVIEEGRIIDDNRYAVLPNMAARRQAFADWSKDTIRALQERRKNEEKADPRIAYLQFLHENASPKLYWVEFKRKWKREAVMIKDGPKFGDREREKLYREHIVRLKLPEDQRRKDLKGLLSQVPLEELHGESTMESLPNAVTANAKFITLPIKARNKFLRQHISGLGPPPDLGVDLQAQRNANKDDADRQRREAALAEREKHVEEEKRKQNGALRHGRQMMEEEQQELQPAGKVSKDGLRGYMDENEE